MTNSKYKHIVISNYHEVNDYTSTRSYRNQKNIPNRVRQFHSNYLKSKFENAWNDAEETIAAVSHAERNGIYIEFKSDPGADLIIKSLEDLKSKKIRLLNVRTETTEIDDQNGNENRSLTTTFATVYIAKEKKNHFLKKIEEYANKESRSGKPKNADLINSIADIRKALSIESFWQDRKDLIPAASPEWCEVWLSSDTQETINRFNDLLEILGIQSREGFIRFPERAIKVIYADNNQLEMLSLSSDDIAEYRLAKTTTEFWTSLKNFEQAEWVNELLERTTFTADANVAICILDTGVNNGHPLLSPVLSEDNCHTIKPNWGTYDHDKHGTLMAGIAAYGDIQSALSENNGILINHHLESVKIFHNNEDNPRELWGYLTKQGISRAEIQSPEINRVNCMAVTAKETLDYGRPSSWSGALDQLIAGSDDGIQRLFIISAGNTIPNSAIPYPKSQIDNSINDPAQAWNIITVGAYTALDTINDNTFSSYKPIAPKYGLSPFSTTSVMWEDNKWPIKPEILLEGGNLACDKSGFTSECDDLSLLSTFFDPQTYHFYPFNMTSAATAQASWMAAQIYSAYPDFWPETIRALLVHSAEWTDELIEQFAPNLTKSEIKKLLRICGYGVPKLERAIYSAANSLTLISQAELQPFDKKRDENGNPISGYSTNDMHLYELPWPKDVLLSLPFNTKVNMRVTLSYFIEPGPGEIGWKDRYRYASHALRFDLISPTESKEEFIQRINRAARDESYEQRESQSAASHWKIGQSRDKGSIHSDIWEGTASELANSNIIAVSPRIGWWRERAYLGKWNSKTRYSLIVSIHTPEENVDIYTPVANQVGIAVESVVTI